MTRNTNENTVVLCTESTAENGEEGIPTPAEPAVFSKTAENIPERTAEKVVENDPGKDPENTPAIDPSTGLPFPTHRQKIRRVMYEYLMLTIGTLLTTVGLYVFAMPNQFVMGGVTGISIVLAEFIPLSAATMVTIMNVILLMVGFAVLGKDFGFKTVYTSLLLSGVGMLLEWAGTAGLEAGASRYPLSGGNLMLELVLAVILPAIGAAIAFYYNGSGGGTDIIAMILRNKFKIESGKALICVDALIMLVSFRYGMEIGLLSAVGLFTKSFIVDKVNLSLNRSKYCIIVTTHPEEVGAYINRVLHRGATMWRGQGVYTGEEKYIMMVVMNVRQVRAIRSKVKSIDEHAFIVVDDTSDIIGNGFRALF